jgi:tRNA (cmo5U34)-methyltransferase
MPDAPQPDVRSHFSDPAAIARYAEGPPRFVPGFDALHTMTSILLAEAAPPDAHVLVLGAGGGLELRSLALANPGWRFTGVDPSGPMLALAAQTLGPLADRVTLVEGLIDAAPAGPFDAATCLLTLHFLPAAARSDTLAALHTRLRPGAPFVAAHLSFPQAERPLWLARYAAFARAQGAPAAQTEQASVAVGSALPLLDPAIDEDLMRAAGFADPTLFFAAFTWRGWIAHA